MEPSANLLKKLNRSFKKLSPIEILGESINVVFKNKITYVCSFGTESAIILHMISKIDKNLQIILINTNFLFNETHQYKDYLMNRFDLNNLKEIFPDSNDLLLRDSKNVLWQTDQDNCCNIRKVMPLQKELKNYNAWISGRKSYHDDERTNLPILEIVNSKIVVNPLANVTKEFVDLYFEKENINRHPLFQKGYLSIGCIHCTKRTTNPDNIRSGRWSNKIKTECGIHYDKNK